MSKFIKSFTQVVDKELSKPMTPFQPMPEPTNDQIVQHLTQVLSENKWLIVSIIVSLILVKWA